MRKICKILLLFSIIYFYLNQNILAEETDITNQIGSSLEINKYLNTFDIYLKAFSMIFPKRFLKSFKEIYYGEENLKLKRN